MSVVYSVLTYLFSKVARRGEGEFYRYVHCTGVYFACFSDVF